MLSGFWVSSETNLDGFRILVDVGNNGSYEGTSSLFSGVPVVTLPVSYPAAHPESIAVGSSSNFDCRSGYSQYGPEVAFLAPSGAGPLNLRIETTDRTGAAGYNTTVGSLGNYTEAAGVSGFSGTSSATPLASGIAGLILSHNPSLTRAKVLQIMQSTADKVGPENYVSGRNDRYGFGRLNAYEALLKATPAVLIDDIVVNEGNSGTASATFTVSVSPTSGVPVTVQYATVQGTATRGVDYTTTTGTLNFAAGEGPKSIVVPVIGDTTAEIDESFTVRLSSPVGAAIGDDTGIATIVDNDATADLAGHMVNWTKPVNVDSSQAGRLVKTGVAGWNAAAVSGKALLSGDGSVEFTAAETNTIRMAGLSRGNTNTDYSDIDFAIYLNSNGNYFVLESGVTRGSSGLYAAGDRFTVKVTNGVVSYQKNGVTVYTSLVAPVYPLLVDTALFSPGATLVDVVLSGKIARDVIWTNLVGTTATGSALSKNVADGWNAGAASTRALVSGDGFVELTAAETDTTRMLGLSRDNTNTDWADIDFGLYLYSNATVYIVEGGLTRGIFGAYVTGDRFQVAIESGVVVYRRNGVLLYTSSLTPTYPLLVDAAMYTTGATLTDVALAGQLRDGRDLRGRGGCRRERQHADEDRRAGLERGRDLVARVREGGRLRRVHDERGNDVPQARRTEPR